MKPVPPPLPKKVALRSVPEAQASNHAGNQQTALMLAGLVILVLFILGLLALIVNATKTGDSVAKAGEDEVVDAGVIGEERFNSASVKAESNEGNDGRQPSEQSTTEGSASTIPQSETAAEKPTESAAETRSTSEEVEMDELPKDARVIPLFSKPIAASAPTLETSNPFLDAGKANTVVFVIDKSSSMSESFGRVIKALNQSLDRLKEDQSFQLIFFDDAPRQNPSFSGLIKATKKNKQAMMKWVENHISADGGTEPLSAVSLAIDLMPKRIIILSDGEFNLEYVEIITQYNSRKSTDQIRIDCVGLNEVVESLQQIARRNGPGIYYQAR